MKSNQYFPFSQIGFGSPQVSAHSTMCEILAHMYMFQISISLRITRQHVLLWIYIRLHQNSSTKPNRSHWAVGAPRLWMPLWASTSHLSSHAAGWLVLLILIFLCAIVGAGRGQHSQHTFHLLVFALLALTQDPQTKRSHLVCHSSGRQ